MCLLRLAGIPDRRAAWIYSLARASPRKRIDRDCARGSRHLSCNLRPLRMGDPEEDGERAARARFRNKRKTPRGSFSKKIGSALGITNQNSQKFVIFGCFSLQNAPFLGAGNGRACARCTVLGGCATPPPESAWEWYGLFVFCKSNAFPNGKAFGAGDELSN